MIRALFIDLVDLLKKHGSTMANDIRDGVPKAEGKLKDSIKSEVTSSGNIVSLTIEAADHFRFVELGRKKGKFPPLSAIRRWCEVKGIPVRAAFPIARAIKERGIAPRHILKGVISRSESGLNQQIRKVFGAAIKIEAENMVRRVFEKKAA